MAKFLKFFKNIYIFYFKAPLGFLTIVFFLVFTFFTFFQTLYFKYYLDNSLKSKVENTLIQIENKLSDYVKFLENVYKIPFIPEFAELPESKGWLVELVDSLEDLFRKERFLSLAIFYQKELFLSWNYKKMEGLPMECKDTYYKEGSLLKVFKKTTIEHKDYCIYLSLDISNYQKTFYRYALMVIFLYTLTVIMVFYLFSRFKEAEERKKEAEKSLQAERELALLGRMAATFAHELRNSLNNLFLLMQASSSINFPQDKILSELKGLLDWTQEILLFHKNLKIEPQYFDPEMLVYELKLLSANLENKKVTLLIENKANTLWGDPFWIKRAVENLIKNSFQAIEKDGIIKVHIEEKGHLYVIEVYDNGPPIPEAIKENIFEPFFTTKKEGFGLGLYLVKKIMEAHRGTVEIENLPSYGKIFRLKWKAYEKR
ncbi:MAG: sensor histidine kinase [Caldimicrobium sp.]